MERKQQIKMLGKSLVVPSVQEMVANQESPAVPPRYIRSDPSDGIRVDPSDHIQVPIIDMEALLSGQPLELHRLHAACRDWGFFQVVKHGVSTSLIERFKVEVKELFDLPMEVKRKYWQTVEELEGFGQIFVMSEDQKLDWGDVFFLRALPKTLRKPHLLPMLPLPLRDTLESYSSEVNRLVMEILGCMERALGMEEKGYLTKLFENSLQSIRMNYYPPCPEPDKVMGLAPHSDADGLTILLQINEVDALQVKKDGSWISVKPLPDAFIVNIGDSLEIVTNGEYLSNEHRAVVNQTKERLSVAAFHCPGLDKQIGPAPCLINTHNPARFRSIKTTEYLEGFFARELYSKSNLDTMKI